MNTSPLTRIIYAGLATVSGLVLLFGYRTSHGEMLTAEPAPTSTAAPTSPTSPTSTASPTSPTAASSLQDGRYTGDPVSTPYGPVQVQITVSGQRIDTVDVLRYPDGNRRDQQINSRALPQLVSETTSAQSSSIHMVSGATYTSHGYQQSLQSALDQAQS